jgi:hypothetical protein
MRIDHAHSLGSALAYKPTIYRRSVTVRPPVASALVERQLRRGDRNAHIGDAPCRHDCALTEGIKALCPLSHHRHELSMVVGVAWYEYSF